MSSSLYTIVWDTTHSKYVLNIVDRSTIATTTTFYIYVSNKDATTSEPFTSRIEKFSSLITWKIICSPTSATITEGSYSSSLNDNQEAEVVRHGSSHSLRSGRQQSGMV